MHEHCDIPLPKTQTLLDTRTAEAWERMRRLHARTKEQLAHTQKQLARTQRVLAISYALLDRWP
jgi:hypothetical protein